MGFRLPARLYLTTAYRYVDTDRWLDNIDPDEALPESEDNIGSVELRWSGLDYLTLRAGYERLHRSTEWRTKESHTDPADAAQRYSYAGKDQDLFKIAADIYPTDTLNFTVEYRYRKNDYNDKYEPLDIVIGMESDSRHELGLNVDYALGTRAKLFGYFDYARITFKQNQLYLSGTYPDNFWRAEQTEDTYGFGAGAEVTAIPNRLTLSVIGYYENSDGEVDYGFRNPSFIYSALGIDPDARVDIGNWDDYVRVGVMFKATYILTRSLSLIAGYAYEDFDYDDARLDDYRYVTDGTDSNAAFLTAI